MRGVEADTEQVRLAVESRVSQDLAIDCGEFVADSRTEIGEGTAGVNEREEHRLPAILMERNAFTVLVNQLEVRHFVAGSGNVQVCCGFRVSGRRMCGH